MKSEGRRMNGQFRSAPRGGFPGVGVGCGEIHAFKLCSRSMAVRSTGPSDIFGNIWQGYFLVRRSPWPQSGSRKRMAPSSRGISTGLPEAGRWSNRSKLCSASSSGIHSRMAGEISNDEFRMLKLGDEGKVDDTLPEAVETKEELDFAGRTMVPTHCMVAWQQGHWSGSARPTRSNC